VELSGGIGSQIMFPRVADGVEGDLGVGEAARYAVASYGSAGTDVW